MHDQQTQAVMSNPARDTQSIIGSRLLWPISECIHPFIHQESQVFPQNLSVLSVIFYSNVVNSEAVLTGCVTTKYSEGFELYKFHSIIYPSPYPSENIQQPCLLHTPSGQFTKTCNDKSIYHRLYVIFDSLKLSTEGGKIVSISFGSFHLINFIKLKK